MNRTYDRKYIWLQRSLTKDTTTGQDVETFTNVGELWGSNEELKANKKLAFGMLNSMADTEVHLRQFPTIKATDRLREKRFNQLLIVDGVAHDFEANELVVYCHVISEVA